jgi:hypothetical protein
MNSTLAIGSVLALALLALSACQSQTHHQALNAESLRETGAGLEATRVQIDKTLAALNRLVSAQPAQLQSAYDQYSKQVVNMNASAPIADKQAKAVRGESLDYWTMWQESYARIENEQLRKASELRRAAVMGRFDSIQKSYEATRAAFVPFARNLQGIQRVLANDLTPASVQKIAATDVVKSAHADGMEMARNLDAMKLQYMALAEALLRSAPSETANRPTASRAFASDKQ